MVMRAPRVLLVTGAYAPEFSAGGLQYQAAGPHPGSYHRDYSSADRARHDRGHSRVACLCSARQLVVGPSRDVAGVRRPHAALAARRPGSHSGLHRQEHPGHGHGEAFFAAYRSASSDGVPRRAVEACSPPLGDRQSACSGPRGASNVVYRPGRDPQARLSRALLAGHQELVKAIVTESRLNTRNSIPRIHRPSVQM